MTEVRPVMSDVFDSDRLLVCEKGVDIEIFFHSQRKLTPGFEWFTMRGLGRTMGAGLQITGTSITLLCREGPMVQSLLVSGHGADSRTVLFGCGACGFVEYMSASENGRAHVSKRCPGCGAQLSLGLAQRCRIGHTWGKCLLCTAVDNGGAAG